MKKSVRYQAPVSPYQRFIAKQDAALAAAAQHEARGNIFMAKRMMREAELFGRHAQKAQLAA